jgi:glucan phosphoethanolaminetransferase (alkaline phosphatase superfamily)
MIPIYKTSGFEPKVIDSMQDKWVILYRASRTCLGRWKQNWLRSPYIFLPLFSFLLLLLYLLLFRCFLYNSYNSKLSHPTVPIYISYFPALEPVLWTYTMLSSPIYSLKSCVQAFQTSRELCAVPLMANTKAKHHDHHMQNTRVWTQSDGLDAG